MLNRILLAVCISAAALAAEAAPADKVVLDVKGMDCAACPITVKAVLRKQPGVEDVKVDMKAHTAEVIFDSGKVAPDKLAHLVTEAGFPTTVRK